MKPLSQSEAVYRTAAFGAAAGALIGILFWSRRLEPGILVLSGIAILVSAWFAWRLAPRSPWVVGALFALLIAHAAALIAERNFRHIEFDWDRVVAERTERLEARLADLMLGLTERGEEAARLAAENAADNNGLFSRLASVRRRTDVDAIAVFGPDGGLVAWAGDHRGRVPDAVRDGLHTAYFAERPLYSYLYFSADVDGGERHAVAAVLVERGALPRAGTSGLATTIAARPDMPAVFRSGPGRPDQVAWSLVSGAETVLHARLDPFTQADIRASVELSARRNVVGASLLALLLMSVGWLRAGTGSARGMASTAPLVLTAVATTVAPLGDVLALEGHASSLAFLIPVPGVSLGDVIATLLAAAALIATFAPVRVSKKWPVAVSGAAALLALVYAGTLRGLLAVVTTSLFEGGTALWLGIQLSTVLILTVLTAALLPLRTSDVEGGRGLRTPLMALSVAIAVALGIAVQAWAFERRVPLPQLAVLWGLPVLILGFGSAGASTAAQRLGRWLVIGLIAATAVLPQLWGAHTQARLRSVEEQLGSFGLRTPPIVEYLLETFRREVMARDKAGESGLQLLYRSWAASGLAQEPYPLRITLWRDEPAIELRLGGAQGSDLTSAAIRTLVHENARNPIPPISTIAGMANENLLLTIPLDSSRIVSVTVEPRRLLQQAGFIAPFLGDAGDPGAGVRLIPPRGPAPPIEDIEWLRSADGWRSDVMIVYGDGPYHAHTIVGFTSPVMRAVRATLIITFDLMLLILLWAGGHFARGIRVVRETAVRGWIRTYRARATAALFAFFLVPTVVFGWLAWHGLSAVVTEAAGSVAQRAVREAVVEWPHAERSLRELSVRTGSDVLYYLNGELIDASSPEGIALGVYGAWMAPTEYGRVTSGEETTAREIGRIETLSYLTAYEVLQPSGTLAVPVALSVGDTASRQRDIASMAMLGAVLGLLLSGALSVVVGRALTGPIGQLRRAAVAVGAGNLNVKLPEPSGGEFGEVFTSFNRMVRRLRRARAQEVRTARILAWGEMAQQIAHEIKNPLTPIKLAVQHLRRAYRDGRTEFGTVLDDNVDQILIEINRLTEISRAFSRYGAPPQSAGPLTDVDVGAIVHEAIMLYRAGDSSVDYGEEIDPTVPSARARTKEVREVLMNLLENARDAVGERGTVTVSVRSLEDRVELTVKDDGAGIPTDLLPRIFDPHFSTRSTGTGLGLAIVRRLVESWGGDVAVESRPGSGTTFRLTLPAVREAAADAT